MRAHEFITEIFDTMPPYDVVEDDPHHFKVTTQIGDESIFFEARIYSESIPMVAPNWDLPCWDIIFGLSPTHGRSIFRATGTGAHFKVMPFVIQCTKMLVNRAQGGVDAYTFSAPQFELSKIKLYRHLTQKFPSTKYITLEKHEGNSIGFYLINREYLKTNLITNKPKFFNPKFDMGALPA